MGLVFFLYTLRVKKNVHCGFPTFLCRRVLELISTHIYLVVVFTEIDCTLLETCYCVYLYIYMFYRVTPPGDLSGFCFLNCK